MPLCDAKKPQSTILTIDDQHLVRLQDHRHVALLCRKLRKIAQRQARSVKIARRQARPVKPKSLDTTSTSSRCAAILGIACVYKSTHGEVTRLATS